MLPLRINKTQLNLQDQYIDLEDVTEFHDTSVFSIEQLAIRSYEKDYLVQMLISIEMNLDQKQ